MVKKSENLKKCQKSKKYIFFAAKKTKYAILLVLPIEEISLRPELSSPAHFKIQGGSPEPDGEEGQRKSLCLIFDI